MPYPFFIYAEHRGAVFTWIELPENYQEVILNFYQKGGREEIEEFARSLDRSLEDIFGKPDIRLNWDDQRGLVNISIGVNGGMDLDSECRRFVEHNLGSRTSLITGAIAINYVSELLKIQRQ